MGVHDEKKTEHPSFGALVLSRPQCTPRSLFGSSVLHQHYIQFTLYKAHHSLNKDLQMESVVQDKMLAEFSMSEVQLSQLLFGADRGSGIPVTLEAYTDGKWVKTNADSQPVTSKASDYSEELAKDLTKLKADLSKVREKLGEMERGGTVKKSDLKEVIADFNKADMAVNSSIEFLFTQFQEKMESVVMQAKGEIEAHFKNRVMALGLDAATKNPVKLLETKAEKTEK